MRVFGVGIGAVILYFYTGWFMTLGWGVAFLAALGVQYFHGKSRYNSATTRDLAVQIVLSYTTIAAFMWLPIYMFIYPDDLLRIAGGVSMALLMVYFIHTGDRLKPMIWGQVGMLALGAIAILIANWKHYDTLIAFIGQIFILAALILFMAISLFAARKRRLDMEAAAARSAQAQKMEAIGQISGGIAHHFNNLLAVIIGNIELCEDTTDDAEREKLRNNAYRAALNGKRLVQLMLEFTAQERATLDRVSAKDLLDNLVHLESQIVSDGVSLNSETVPPDCHVLVDKDLFMTAMIHLVSNALDAMDNDGRIEIEVHHQTHNTPLTTVTGRQVAPGNYVAFTVRDTGRGIDAQHLPRVAEPFFTTKPVGQGAGLGLSMVAGFAERHGGGLLVASAAAGTTATLLLPIHVT